MYNSKVIKSLACITILFQIIFVGFTILFYDELYLNPHVIPIPYDEWNLMVDAVVFDDQLAKIVTILAYAEEIIYISGGLYVVASTGNPKRIPEFILAIFVSYGIYKGIILLIRHFYTCYHMFMILIPAEILSLLLLYLILRSGAIRRKNKEGRKTL